MRQAFVARCQGAVAEASLVIDVRVLHRAFQHSHQAITTPGAAVQGRECHGTVSEIGPVEQAEVLEVSTATQVQAAGSQPAERKGDLRQLIVSEGALPAAAGQLFPIVGPRRHPLTSC